jgi:hypothetical protein
LSRIRTLIEKVYDLNAFKVDFALILLEKNQDNPAEKILSDVSTFIAEGKFKFIINREESLKRPDVMHKLFKYYTYDESKSKAFTGRSDLLMKAATLYCKNKINF